MTNSSVDEVKKNGRCLSVPAGSSMQPMLYNKENVVELVKVTHPLKKYDVSLHTRKDGSNVLHRVMQVKDGEYVICGDNCIVPEVVSFDQVSAVVTRFYRKGKWIPVTNKKYQIYVKIWCGLFPVRKYVLKLEHVFKKIIKLNFL